MRVTGSEEVSCNTYLLGSLKSCSSSCVYCGRVNHVELTEGDLRQDVASRGLLDACNTLIQEVWGIFMS